MPRLRLQGWGASPCCCVLFGKPVNAAGSVTGLDAPTVQPFALNSCVHKCAAHVPQLVMRGSFPSALTASLTAAVPP